MLFVLYVAPAIEYETYEVTAYTAGAESTGKTPDHPAYGITASGAPVEQGVTIACPPELAFGTMVYLPYFVTDEHDGIFECQDRGGAITAGKIDVYMDDLDEALAFGRRELDVAIINDNEGELRVKIRIIKASKPTYWYANMIGEVFEADEWAGDYYVSGTEFVRGEDCEEIDDTTIRMDALEKRIAELESQLRVAQEDLVLIEEGICRDIARITDDIKRLESEIDLQKVSEAAIKMGRAFGNVGTSIAEALQMIHPEQPTRDEIVAKAIADVEMLSNEVYSGDSYNTNISVFKDCGHLRFDFVVNRSKRTVVALGYLRYADDGTPYAKGIAKCAPNDVFNAHLGKAIALRRALGLDVPAEYLNAPQPEKARVGDLIYDKHYKMSGKVYASNPVYRTYGKDVGYYFGRGKGWLAYIDPDDYERRIRQNDAKVIDDTASTEREAERATKEFHIKSFKLDCERIKYRGGCGSSSALRTIGPLGYTVEAIVSMPDMGIAIDGKFTFVADRPRTISQEAIENDIRKLFTEGCEC